MSVEENKKSAEQIGTLGSCLIEGDSEQKARERKTKRRALIISITLQSAVLVALVLTPLLGRTEKLPSTLFTPIPQYYHSAQQPTADTRQTRAIRRIECVVCFNDHLSPRPAMHSSLTHSDVPPGDGPVIDVPGNFPAGSGLFDRRTGPAAPEDPNRNQKKRLVKGGDVQQAMLIRRVEPSYPPLMRNIRRSGKVEIRAIISVDGTIESLQVLSGDPRFYQSALEAVGQWRYRPTILNGQPVEVETIITVVYTLNQ